MKKIIVVTLLISMIFTNGLLNANAVEWPYKHELTHTNEKLRHVPFWLFEEEDSKNSYEKKYWSRFQEESKYFLDDLFGDSWFENGDNDSIRNQNILPIKEASKNLEEESFLDNLFWNTFEWEQEGSVIIDNEFWEQWNQVEETRIEEEWLDDIDTLFWDLFWKSIEQYSNIAISNQKKSIKNRKLKFKIEQKKKRILSKRLASIQVL